MWKAPSHRRTKDRSKGADPFTPAPSVSHSFARHNNDRLFNACIVEGSRAPKNA